MVAAREFIPTLSYATERDVDILLVEELACSSDFVAWVAEHAGWKGQISDWRVLHSKRRIRNRREIDIHVEINSPDSPKPIVLLIENKLDASEQPDQGESYQQEIDRLKPDTSFAAALLICPSAYSAAHSDFAEWFDSVLLYEAVIDRLRARTATASNEIAQRLSFRCDLLEQALHKYRRGYEPILNTEIGSFNKQYVALLSNLAPEIIPGPSMLKEANPDESVSMIFDAAKSLAFMSDDIRPRRFAHEFGRGQSYRANYVAVTFPKWGRNFDHIKDVLKNDVDDTNFQFSAKKPNKNRPNPGLTLFIKTLAVDNQGEFAMQQHAIMEGIVKAVELRNWLAANLDTLRRWRDIAEQD